MISRMGVSTPARSLSPDPARYRPTAGRPEQGRGEPEAFDEALGFIARRLRFSVTDLTEKERDLLDDYGRGASKDGEVRYRLKTLRALLAIAARSNRLEDRDALPELFRAEILRLAGAEHCLTTAFDVETATTGPADVAQREFEKAPSPGTWIIARDALMKQAAATRFAIDALLIWSAAT